MEIALFAVYALIACGSALAVVFSQNVVRMAFWLVLSLGAVAGLFFLLNADFLGATQLLIYVGGTVVLLIFGVMLTASGPFRSIQSTSGEIVQASVIGGIFLGLLLFTVTAVDWAGNKQTLGGRFPSTSTKVSGYNTQGEGATVREIGAAMLGPRFDQDFNSDSSAKPISRLSSGYLLPFEVISVHLLVVLVGAAYLARAKRRRAE